jgi:hypothetical protein
MCSCLISLPVFLAKGCVPMAAATWFFGKIYNAWSEDQWMEPLPMQVEEPGTPSELPAGPAVEAAAAAANGAIPPAATTQSLLEAVQASVLIAEAVSPTFGSAATTAPAAPAATSGSSAVSMEDCQLAADETFAEQLLDKENLMGSTAWLGPGQSGGSTDVLMGTPCNQGAAPCSPTSPADAVPVIHLDLGEDMMEAVNAVSLEADSDQSSIGFYSSENCPNNKLLPEWIGLNWRFIASFVWDYQTTKADALAWCNGDGEKLFG